MISHETDKEGEEMANVHLVTGYAGSGHISAVDQGSFNAALFGEGNYVLNRGNKFAASVITNNKIRISDGDLIMQGRHVRFYYGASSVDLTIENGEAGKTRHDLIVCRYTKSSSEYTEQCNLVVIKGTAVTDASRVSDPEYNSGSIFDGDSTVDFPLYRVPISGLTVGTLVPLFSVTDNLLPEDYITAEGTTDGWTWRKWASGIAECWCSKTITNKACNIAQGNWYRTAEIQHSAYPFAFTATPNINMFFETASGTGGLVWSAGTATDVEDAKEQPHQFYIIRMSAASAISGKVHTFARGKYE